MILQVYANVAVPLVSAIVGGVIAIAGNALLNWNQRRINRNRLRWLFLVEMNTVSSYIEDFTKNKTSLDKINENPELYRHNLRHPVYESNLDKIMLLSEYEMRGISLFYQDVERMQMAIINDEISDSEILSSGRLAISMYNDTQSDFTMGSVRRWISHKRRRWKRRQRGIDWEKSQSTIPSDED